MDGEATQGPAVRRPSKPREARPQFSTIMDFLRHWRSEDHEDNIVLSRNRIIEIIEGVDALSSQREWHPIETAPTDGTRILAWHQDWENAHTVQWFGTYWGVFYKTGPLLFQPTHWMPLPVGRVLTQDM